MKLGTSTLRRKGMQCPGILNILWFIFPLMLALSFAISGCGAGSSSTGNKTPEDPLAKLLNEGTLVKGQVQNNCDNSFVLEAVEELCKLFAIGGGDACLSQTSSCNSYERQIYTGNDISPDPVSGTKDPKWNGRGGSGRLMADAVLCTLRELSPKVPGGGPVLSEKSLNIGIGDVIVKQEVGYLDFDRLNARFKGYRKLRVELPVLGKFDAITQNIELQRTQFGGHSFNPYPFAGDYQILFGYGLNLTTEEKSKSLEIKPPSFNVTTPIGIFEAKPSFCYKSNTVVSDTPFVTDHTYIPLPNDDYDNSPAAIKLSDLYGIMPGVENNTTPSPSVSPFDDYKSKRTGWISQVGLGTRGAGSGSEPCKGSGSEKLWPPPKSGFISRPDFYPLGISDFDFKSYESRSDEENSPSVYARASASLKYPKNPSELLPDWVDGLPGLDWDAYIMVTPTIEAGVAGQFGIGISEGTDYGNDMTKEFGNPHLKGRTSALGIYSGVEVDASFEVDAQLKLYVAADFGWPIGDITLININPHFPIPLAGDNVSSDVKFASALSTSSSSKPDQPEKLDWLGTFKGSKLPEEFINVCYAKEAEVPPEEPPESKTEKGNPEDMFEFLPCNICLATDAVINPNTSEIKEPAHHDILGPVNPTPPAVWQCDAKSKSGCMDLCKLNKETGEFTVVKNPSEIADSIPTTDPDYSKLYPFYKSCMKTCAQDLPPGILDASCGKGLDATPPGILPVVPGGGGAPAPVPVDTNVAASFTEPMDPVSINTSTFTVSDADGNNIAGDVTYVAATYTALFTPRSLNYNSTYTATITTGVRDAAGNPLTADFTWNFTTAPAPANRTAFLTSVQGNGNLGTWADAAGNTGLEAGDAICQARAGEAGLSGTYAAWLSDSVSDAYCRIHNLTGKKADNCGQTSLPVAAGPWLRMDDFPFSGAIDRLVNEGTVYAPVLLDELKNPVISNPATYLTGTKEDGTYDTAAASCNDYTSNSRSVHGIGGYSYGTTYSWTHNYSTGCDASWRLLCMQTGAGMTLPNFASAGKKVFVTSVKGTGNLSTWPDAGGNTGIAAGDAICRARAQAGGLANASNFKAWLSNASVNAIDRLTSNGPWVRPDGVKVADNKADLSDGGLFTAISQTETGTYVSPEVWSGTENNGQLYSRVNSTCNDWTTVQELDKGVSGESSLSYTYWSKLGFSLCSYNLALYCFED